MTQPRAAPRGGGIHVWRVESQREERSRVSCMDSRSPTLLQACGVTLSPPGTLRKRSAWWNSGVVFEVEGGPLLNSFRGVGEIPGGSDCSSLEQLEFACRSLRSPSSCGVPAGDLNAGIPGLHFGHHSSSWISGLDLLCISDHYNFQNDSVGCWGEKNCLLKCCMLVFFSRVSVLAKMLPFQSLQPRHTRLKRSAHTRSRALGPLHRCCTPCSGLKGTGWLAKAAATLVGPKDQLLLGSQKPATLLLRSVESRTLLPYGRQNHLASNFKTHFWNRTTKKSSSKWRERLGLTGEVK